MKKKKIREVGFEITAEQCGFLFNCDDCLLNNKCVDNYKKEKI